MTRHILSLLTLGTKRGPVPCLGEGAKRAFRIILWILSLLMVMPFPFALFVGVVALRCGGGFSIHESDFALELDDERDFALWPASPIRTGAE